ncbi:N-acetyl-gamma-glutamyl-phosphate reductase [Candidatus Woesearchaeota archaeon]|nr:N-acetyl-gamma-glutamyl-phosphate reductase [Candidatus Woesearchaeota archaeon]
MSSTSTPVKSIKVAVVGGSGFIGGELIRLLLHHSHGELVSVTSTTHGGKLIAEVHKNLLGVTNLCFEEYDAIKIAKSADLVFLATPHGTSMELVPDLLHKGVKIIDLSGDFRLKDPEIYAKYYQKQHQSHEHLHYFVYGLPELHATAIAKARYVANPGCFATAVLLGCIPLVTKKLLSDYLIVDAKTGSSGSGHIPKQETTHAFRTNNFYAYKLFTHQHTPEILQELTLLGTVPENFHFITHSAPFVRGIFATIHTKLVRPLSSSELRQLYKDFYAGQPFIRIRDASPESRVVSLTNYCDINVESKQEGKHTFVVVCSALDNLVKGAAGQAIQNMNLMFGFDQRAGLDFLGSSP